MCDMHETELEYTCSEGCGYTVDKKGERPRCPYCGCGLRPIRANERT